VSSAASQALVTRIEPARIASTQPTPSRPCFPARRVSLRRAAWMLAPASAWSASSALPARPTRVRSPRSTSWTSTSSSAENARVARARSSSRRGTVAGSVAGLAPALASLRVNPASSRPRQPLPRTAPAPAPAAATRHAHAHAHAHVVARALMAEPMDVAEDLAPTTLETDSRWLTTAGGLVRTRIPPALNLLRLLHASL
jgi:hypothetical protein